MSAGGNGIVLVNRSVAGNWRYTIDNPRAISATINAANNKPPYRPGEQPLQAPRRTRNCRCDRCVCWRGRATARAFAERGFDVALLARGTAGLEAAAKEVEVAGRRALLVPWMWPAMKTLMRPPAGSKSSWAPSMSGSTMP